MAPIKPVLDKKQNIQFGWQGLMLFRNAGTIIAIFAFVSSSYFYTWNVSANMEKMKDDTNKNTTDIADINKYNLDIRSKLQEKDLESVRFKDNFTDISESLKRLEQITRDTNEKADEMAKSVNTMQNIQFTMVESVKNIEKNMENKK